MRKNTVKAGISGLMALVASGCGTNYNEAPVIEQTAGKANVSNVLGGEASERTVFVEDSDFAGYNVKVVASSDRKNVNDVESMSLPTSDRGHFEYMRNGGGNVVMDFPTVSSIGYFDPRGHDAVSFGNDNSFVAQIGTDVVDYTFSSDGDGTRGVAHISAKPHKVGSGDTGTATMYLHAFDAGEQKSKILVFKDRISSGQVNTGIPSLSLDDVVEWASTEVSRDSGDDMIADMRFYTAKMVDGGFIFEENKELSAEANPYVHHVFNKAQKVFAEVIDVRNSYTSDVSNKYTFVVMNDAFDVTGMRLCSDASCTTEFPIYNSADAPHIAVLNPKGKAMSPGEYVLFADGE